MVSKLKYKKELEKELPLDYFLIEKIPILKRNSEEENTKNFKHFEKYHAFSPTRFSPQKPISKLLDPNDF